MDELEKVQQELDAKSREFTQLSLSVYDEIKETKNEPLLYWFEDKIKKLGLSKFFGI